MPIEPLNFENAPPDWKAGDPLPEGATPFSAEALEAVQTHAGAYTDQEVAAEAATREADDDALEARIGVVEGAMPGKADAAALAAELAARAAGDQALDGRLDVVEAALPGKADDAELAAELAARAAGDQALDGRLDVVEAALPGKADDADLAAELAARTAGDEALDVRVVALEDAPSGGSSAPAGRGQTLGRGSFRRLNRGLPIGDLTGLVPKRAARNARGGYNPVTDVYFFHADVGANNGLTLQPQCEIGYWESPPGGELEDCTYRGIVVSNAMMTGFGVPATHDALATGRAIQDDAGLWHLFVSAVDAYYGTNPTVGGIHHLTAPDPGGPFAYAGLVRDHTSEANQVPTDNGNPVYVPFLVGGPKWVIPFVRYVTPYTGARQYRFLVADGTPDEVPTGPWTLHAAVIASVDGYPMTKDAPQLLVDGGKLFLHATPNAYVNTLYEVTPDLATARYIGPVLNVVGPAANTEGSDAGWGAGSIFHGRGGELYSVWQGGPPSAVDPGYWRVYGGKWVPGEIEVFRFPSPGAILTNNAAVVPGTPLTVTLPADVPPEATAVAIHVEARKVAAAPAAGAYAQVDQGFNWNYGRAFAKAQDAPETFDGVIPLAGGSRTIRLTTVGDTLNVYLMVTGYERNA